MTAAAAIAPPADALETTTLIRVCVGANNNKFYELSKMPDGSTFARWGRVGVSRPQSQTYPGHSSFERKLNEKLGKGYQVFNGSAAAHQSPRPGAPAVQAAHVSAGLFPRGGAGQDDLIAYLIRCNRHAIDTATGGRIQVSDSGAVTTALGAVSRAQIDTARAHLNTLRRGYNASAVEQYLTLIPQPVANVRNRDWVDASWCSDQDDLLAALESALVMATGGGDAAEAIAFRNTLTEIDSSSERFADIAAKVDSSRNTMHDANRLKLRRVWAIEDTDSAAWQACKKELKHSRHLWHGTSAGNVLSILRAGLVCPPAHRSGNYTITGRMFGDGVYFSDQSTKSLNYAIGRAPGQGGRSAAQRPMMFLADVIMGRECRSDGTISGSALVQQSRGGADSRGRAYNSLFVRGGHCGVRNNEMVVWNTDQIKLTYLCEFE